MRRFLNHEFGLALSPGRLARVPLLRRLLGLSFPLLRRLTLLDIIRLLQASAFDEQAPDKANRYERHIEYEDTPTSTSISIQNRILLRRIHPGKIRRTVCRQRQMLVPSRQLTLESILRQRSRDSEANSTARAAQEITVTDDDGSMRLGAVRLRRDERRLEHETHARALDAQDGGYGAERRVPRENAGQCCC